MSSCRTPSTTDADLQAEETLLLDIGSEYSWSWLRHSFLRWTLALMTGIALADHLPAYTRMEGLAVWATLVVLLVGCHVLRKSRLFGVMACVAMAWGGAWLYQGVAPADAACLDETERDYRLVLLENPSKRGKCLKSRAQLLATTLSDEVRLLPARPECVLYLPADTASAALRRGDVLWVHTALEQPTGRGNPDEWDYGQYLRRKGSVGLAFVAPGAWQRVERWQHPSWRMRADWLRDSLVATYSRWGLSEEAQSVLAAQTLGDRQTMDADLRATYQKAGASHVLALSGLHVGLLAWLLTLLFRPLVRLCGRLAPLIFSFELLLLWLFTWLTGCSASAVRAATLFSLLLLATFPHRQRLHSEALMATACWMLLFCPTWLFDIGFQLSFAAVASLLWLHPLILPLWQPRHPFLCQVWQLLSVTLAAQLGTAPLVIYYFSSFPIYFLISNLWVVPWTSVLLLGAGLLWLLTPFPSLAHRWAEVLQVLVDMQHTLLREVGSWPMAGWGPLYIDKVGLCLAYLLVAALGWMLCRRHARSVWSVLACCGGLMLYATWQQIESRPERSLCFYNVRSCPSVYCLASDGRSWLACADSLSESDALARALDAHWTRRHLAPPLRLPTRYQADGVWWERGVLTYGGRRVCLLSDHRWQGWQSPSPLPVDYLLVTAGYRGTLAQLQPLFQIGTVVLHASLSGRRQEALEAECRQLGLPLHNLARQGALCVPLP